MSDVSDLKQHIDQLPDELYHRIHDLVFAVIPGEQRIDRSYRPPTILQMSRRLRHDFAQQYYQRSIFRCSELDTCLAWIRSLPREHCAMIQQIGCQRGADGPSHRIQAELQQAYFMQQLRIALLHSGVQLVDRELVKSGTSQKRRASE